MEEQKVKMGWIGLGTMGGPMAGHMLKAGYDLEVYNRSRDKEKPLIEGGARSAASPKQMLAQVDIVFLMVTDDRATADLFYNDEGLEKSLAPGKRIINMSTVSPDINKELAKRSAEKGTVWIDAPVSGSLKQAQDASLVIMVGAEEKEYAAVRALLQHLGQQVMHVGPSGAGNAAKLAINLLLSIHAQGLAEAVLFAESNGISLHDFFSIFNNGTLANAFGKAKSQAILDNNYTPAFSLRNILKDLRLANQQGMETPLGKAALATFEKAEPELGDEDLIAVAKFLRR